MFEFREVIASTRLTKKKTAIPRETTWRTKLHGTYCVNARKTLINQLILLFVEKKHRKNANSPLENIRRRKKQTYTTKPGKTLLRLVNTC